MDVYLGTAMKKIFCFILPFILPFCSSAQKEKPGCSGVKSGSFYYYPFYTKVTYAVSRTDSEQREIDLVTNDTAWLKVTWIDECSFNLSFMRTTRRLSAEKLRFYHQNQLWRTNKNVQER